MAKSKLTLDAERDLIDVYLFGIEHFGHAQAARYAETINAKIPAAADNPSFGAEDNFVRNGLRRYECVSHAIYYKPTVSGILVLRILHGGLDPGQHLTRYWPSIANFNAALHICYFLGYFGYA